MQPLDNVQDFSLIELAGVWNFPIRGLEHHMLPTLRSNKSFPPFNIRHTLRSRELKCAPDETIMWCECYFPA